MTPTQQRPEVTDAVVEALGFACGFRVEDRERLRDALTRFAKGSSTPVNASEKSEASAADYKLLVRDLAAEMRGETPPTGYAPKDGGENG